jgi:ABC-type transport system involved in cytochrome bd biosynthesis fused ATPase/permease subunit
MYFNFASKYTIRKVQEHQEGLKLKGTRQFLVYADDYFSGLRREQHARQYHITKRGNKSFDSVKKVLTSANSHNKSKSYL